MRLVLLSSLLVGLAEVKPEQLDVDDECRASDRCALEATQLRAVKSQKDQQNVSETEGSQNQGEEAALPGIHLGPEARYSKEELVKLLELHQQRMNSSERWGSSGSSSSMSPMAQPFNLASSCYSFTGGTCAYAGCSSFRMAQCQAGKCVRLKYIR